MKPYYKTETIEIYNSDFREVSLGKGIVITDPPYNQGYGYNEYNDKLSQEEYIKLLSELPKPCVIIHYPEETINLLPKALGMCDEVISWVYNSNTGKQSRLVSFWGIKPDFSKVKQPYKNPNDRRVQELMENGSEGADHYDWLEMDQVKNVSEEKTEHPCQIPLELMKKIILMTTNEGDTVIDPFMGSGTTLLAAKQLGRKAVGAEVSEEYCKIAIGRLSQEHLF